ncbi:hypothetical protein A7U60_g2765 [Sanghuangporus baumii]|uniref:Uncharacterized protein n=1 Tax=Sanghuangporus baumii TaxID=108892 RepID=A0A9Q5I200_SANBA|nr:hypothetical protein A7U60_g2765 [Sanghuangporus baumii]
MVTAPRARRIIDSDLPARPTILSRTNSSFSFLSTSRLVTRNIFMIIMTQKAAAAASTSSSTSQHHVLKPRQQSAPGASNSQSLTFGFAFMAILVSLLIFAHMMQRVANRRQREVLVRMAALQESRELEEVPKLWDMHLRRLKYHGSATGMGSGSEAGVRWKVEERLRWKDMQPLSAHAITTGPGRQTPPGPHDRPLRVSVIIAMPVSPPKRIDHNERLGLDSAEDGPPYFELGVTTIK